MLLNVDELPLDESDKDLLRKEEIRFVLQPIVYPDGKTIFAYEVLMRPKNKSPMELIDEYAHIGKLHVLEVASAFGASAIEVERNLSVPVTINSFPSEILTSYELEMLQKLYGCNTNEAMTELLEYPHFDEELWLRKKEEFNKYQVRPIVDDFGSGLNNLKIVDIIEPQIVKFDKALISGIDHDKNKQENFKYYCEEIHRRGIKVLAEGVETAEEFLYLKNCCVDLFQGFYFGKPE